MSREIRVCDDPVAELAAILREAARPGANVALSGGSTPRPAYTAAAGADWAGATVWLVDDRVVAPGDPLSNYRLVRETLGDVADVQRVETEHGAEEAARRYDEALAGVTLDLAVLGMGSDGHTASLFPGRPELAEDRRRVVAVPEAGMEPYVERVTMTFPFLASAHRRVFLVVGADKRDPLARIDELPAGRVEDALFLVDEAAAG